MFIIIIAILNILWENSDSVYIYCNYNVNHVRYGINTLGINVGKGGSERDKIISHLTCFKNGKKLLLYLILKYKNMKKWGSPTIRKYSFKNGFINFLQENDSNEYPPTEKNSSNDLIAQIKIQILLLTLYKNKIAWYWDI